MTDRDSKQLPLPAPRSPRELDAKILAHARANAPERNRPLAWMGGLASAAVLVLAVFIADLGEQPIVHEEEAAAAAAAPAMESSADVTTASRAAPMPMAKMKAERQRDAAPGAAFSAQANLLVEDERLSQVPQDMAAIQRMWQAGNTAEAEQAYQVLRETCTDCGLPESLEAALALFPEEPPNP